MIKRNVFNALGSRGLMVPVLNENRIVFSRSRGIRYIYMSSSLSANLTTVNTSSFSNIRVKLSLKNKHSLIKTTNMTSDGSGLGRLFWNQPSVPCWLSTKCHRTYSTKTDTDPQEKRQKIFKYDEDPIAWDNMTFFGKSKHLFKQFAYTFVIFAGVGIIGLTGYEVYQETIRSKQVNDVYDYLLHTIAQDPQVLKFLKAPIKGQFQMEWRNKSQRRIINQFTKLSDGTDKLTVQFSVYGANGVKGILTSELVPQNTVTKSDFSTPSHSTNSVGSATSKTTSLTQTNNNKDDVNISISQPKSTQEDLTLESIIEKSKEWVYFCQEWIQKSIWTSEPQVLPWKQYVTMLDLPQLNKTLVLVDERQRTIDEKKGWFGWNRVSNLGGFWKRN